MIDNSCRIVCIKYSKQRSEILRQGPTCRWKTISSFLCKICIFMVTDKNSGISPNPSLQSGYFSMNADEFLTSFNKIMRWISNYMNFLEIHSAFQVSIHQKGLRAESEKGLSRKLLHIFRYLLNLSSHLYCTSQWK